MIHSSRRTLPSGDVVLCNLPPYNAQPWLSMGVVLHAALLAEAGIRASILRPLDPPFLVPPSVAHASRLTLTFDPPLGERLQRMDAAARQWPRFFDAIVDELLAGGESVICLSIFRNNVDLTLEVALKLKRKRPSVRIVLGGPEAVEEPAPLCLPFIDAVVGLDAETVIVPLVRGLLDGKLPALPHVWRPGAGEPPPALPSPPLEVPRIDYRAIMPLYVGDPVRSVPLLLNWGCPYRCGFCSNRGIYGRFTPGNIGRVLSEMDDIVHTWESLHDGAAPQLDLQLSDATTNALPQQLDALLAGVVARAPTWGQRPRLRGQTLFDDRITDERVRLWGEANFANTFFGVDGASDRLRQSLHKPGTLDEVFAAMARYHQGGKGGLTFGLPVGLPGETEADFAAAERFVDRALTLDGTIMAVTVMPYVFFRSAQDPSLQRLNRGEARGVLWRADLPGGDPAERARRFMRLFDHIDRRAPTLSPIPAYLVLPAMLPDEDPALIDAWLARHGRVSEQLSVEDQVVARAWTASYTWSRAQRTLEAPHLCGEWTVEHSELRKGDGDPQRLVVLFRRDGERVAVRLEPHDPTRQAFAHTRDFNVTYQRDWRGVPCAVDLTLLRRCIGELQRAEREEHASSV